MVLNGFWEVFLAAAMGPVLVEAAKFYRLKGERIQARYRKPQYWLLTLPMVPISGLIAAAQGTQDVPLLLALQLGTTAPLLIGAWASASSPRQAGVLPQPARSTAWQLLGWR